MFFSRFCEVEQQHLQTHQCWGQTVGLHSRPHHLATLKIELDALLSNSLYFERGILISFSLKEEFGKGQKWCVLPGLVLHHLQSSPGWVLLVSKSPGIAKQ